MEDLREILLDQVRLIDHIDTQFLRLGIDAGISSIDIFTDTDDRDGQGVAEHRVVNVDLVERRGFDFIGFTADKKQTVVADGYEIDLAFDRVHFSGEGHRQFAREMEKVLLSIL